MEKEITENILDKIEMKYFTRCFIEYIDIFGERKIIDIKSE